MDSDRHRWIAVAAVGLSGLVLAAPSAALPPAAKPKPTPAAAARPALATKPKPTPAAPAKPAPAAKPKPTPKLTASGSAARATGLKLASESKYSKMDKRRLAFSAGGKDPPKQIDLSADLPPPGDQGDQGSCTGWAVGYGLKSYLAKAGQKWDLATESGTPNYGHVFSPAYVYNSTKTKEGGVTLEDTLTFVRDRGVATWADFPYDPKDEARLPGDQVQREATRWRIKSWQALRVMPLDIRQQISQGRPVVIGAQISRDFKNGKLEPGAVWKKAGTLVEAHAMLLVGYDDDKKAFKLMNSWGTQWGDGGYAWLAYDLLPKVVREAYVATDYSPTEAAAPPPPLPEPAVATPALANMNMGEPAPAVATAPIARKSSPILVGFMINSGDVLGGITPIFRDQTSVNGTLALSQETRLGPTIGGGGAGGATLQRDGAYVVALRIKLGNYFGANHVISFQADLRDATTGAVETSEWYGSGAYATEISEPIVVKANDRAFISGFEGTSLTHTDGLTFVSTVDIVETSLDWYK